MRFLFNTVNNSPTSSFFQKLLDKLWVVSFSNKSSIISSLNGNDIINLKVKTKKREILFTCNSGDWEYFIPPIYLFSPISYFVFWFFFSFNTFSTFLFGEISRIDIINTLRLIRNNHHTTLTTRVLNLRQWIHFLDWKQLCFSLLSDLFQLPLFQPSKRSQNFLCKIIIIR